MAVSHSLVILLLVIHTKERQEESALQTEKKEEETGSLHPPDAQQKQASLFPPGSCHVAQGLGRGCRELTHLPLCERVNRKCPDLCNKMAHSPLGGRRMIRILSTPRPNGPVEGRLNKVLHIGRGT